MKLYLNNVFSQSENIKGTYQYLMLEMRYAHCLQLTGVRVLEDGIISKSQSSPYIAFVDIHCSHLHVSVQQYMYT